MVEWLNESVPTREIVAFDCSVERYFPECDKTDLEDFFKGARIIEVRNFAKFLIFHTNRGILLAHNKFTGWFEFGSNPFRMDYVELGKPPGLEKYKARWVFDDGDILLFHDARQLGDLQIYPEVYNEMDIPRLQKFGPVVDTDKWTLDRFKSDCAKTGRKIKILLLDQTKQAGVGNIYALEALYVAGVNPWTVSRDLPEKCVESLYGAVKVVIEEAKQKIHKDYTYLKVFRQEKCPLGHEVVREEQQKRGTYWCNRCQDNTKSHFEVFGGSNAVS